MEGRTEIVRVVDPGERSVSPVEEGQRICEGGRIIMKTNSALVCLIKCPYCPAHAGILAVDTDRLRAVDSWYHEAVPKVGLRKAVKSGVLVCDPDVTGGRPCRHLVIFAGNLGWVGAEPDSGTIPMAIIRVRWADEGVKGAVGARWSVVEWVLDSLRAVGDGDPPRPAVPFRVVEANVSENRSARDGSWTCHLLADAVFTPDPGEFAADLQAKTAIRAGGSPPD
jgi:hypothetical protein